VSCKIEFSLFSFSLLQLSKLVAFIHSRNIFSYGGEDKRRVRREHYPAIKFNEANSQMRWKELRRDKLSYAREKIDLIIVNNKSLSN